MEVRLLFIFFLRYDGDNIVDHFLFSEARIFFYDAMVLLGKILDFLSPVNLQLIC